MGASGLMIAALWSAGFPPQSWFRSIPHFLRSESNESKPAISVEPALPVTAAPRAASTAVDTTALNGTDSSISATPHPLQLISTEPGRNLREGRATLGIDVKNPQIYSAGAILANGARLTEIHADYVVLEGEGESTRLYRNGADRGPRRGRNSKLFLVGGAQPAPAPKTTTREIIVDYLRPSPIYDGEILQGYVVYPGVRSGVFSQLGLQGGDVITALNDVPFSDAVQAYELFRQLATGIAMTATLNRKGRLQRVTLDGSYIVADLERTGSSQ